MDCVTIVIIFFSHRASESGEQRILQGDQNQISQLRKKLVCPIWHIFMPNGIFNLNFSFAWFNTLYLYIPQWYLGFVYKISFSLLQKRLRMQAFLWDWQRVIFLALILEQGSKKAKSSTASQGGGKILIYSHPVKPWFKWGWKKNLVTS